VGLSRVELLTSRLSGVRSNHLSYRPNSFSYSNEPEYSSKVKTKKIYSVHSQDNQAESIFKLSSALRRRRLLRKEVIQPHLPIRLPCYDLAPVTDFTLVGCLLAVGEPVSGTPSFHGLTGGVYKARERIHRAVLMRDY
jgi:hypothetical protein